MSLSLLLGALAWNADLLASGSRDRLIMLHDTRVVPIVPEKRLAGHRQEVSDYKVVDTLSAQLLNVLKLTHCEFQYPRFSYFLLLCREFFALFY